MKIILAALNARYNHTNLAIRYIKSFCSEQDIEIYESTINDNTLDIAYEIAEKYPDVVCFSCYIWNIENTLKICGILKKLLPEVKIALGGPEVSYDACDVLKNNECIDFIMMGEGEITSRELFYAIDSGKRDFRKIDGIAFRDGKKIIQNKERHEIEDINIIPFPYENDIPDKIIYYEASRGCPFNCSYCLSSAIKGVRYRDIGKVKKELKYFIDNDVKLVKFVDRTFNSNKEYAMDIWKYLIDNKKNTRFHFEIEADILDKDEIELLNTAPKGLFQLEIGVQTTNLKVLKNINRAMSFEKLKENVDAIEKADNIHCHLDLIAGLPGENIESFKNSFDMCMKIMPDMLQLGFLKMLKGSPALKQVKEYDISYMSYPPYQVLSTHDMPFEDVYELIKIENVFDGYYNSGIMPMTMSYVLKNVDSTFDFFKKLNEYIERMCEYKRGLGLNEKYEMFLNYTSENLNTEVLKDLMLHDYVINTKKSYVPEFLKRDLKCAKEIVNKNMDIIEKNLDCKGPKSLFFVPVKYRVKKSGREYTVQNSKAVLVVETKSGKYMYLDL